MNDASSYSRTDNNKTSLLTPPTHRHSLRWYHRLCVRILAQGPIPYHVAFIMDGNRRHARSRKKPVISGHHDGYGVLLDVLEVCILLGVRVVTVYAFSMDNFNRPEEEVSGLMSLACDKLVEMGGHQDVLQRHSVQVRVLGDIARLPLRLQEAVSTVEERTRDFNGARLNICVSYGGCEELCHMWGSAAANMLSSGVSSRQCGKTDHRKDVMDVRECTAAKGANQQSSERSICAASTVAAQHAYLHPAHRCAHAGAPGHCCVREGLGRVLDASAVDICASSHVPMDAEARSEVPLPPHLRADEEEGHPRANSPCALWQRASSAMRDVWYGARQWLGAGNVLMPPAPPSILSHPRPALILRTSGEQRLSDFLLAGGGAAQLQFCHMRWPEFSAWDVCEAILKYQRAHSRTHAAATALAKLRRRVLMSQNASSSTIGTGVADAG